jgi:hypothetical protein
MEYSMAGEVGAFPTHDDTARRLHQWAMLGLVVAGYLVGSRLGAGLLAVASAIMLVGLVWWPADLVRQILWRVADPAGWRRRQATHADHAGRRMARALGGATWLLAVVLIVVGAAQAGWVLAGVIGVLVGLDAAVDFCGLCFVVAQLDLRGWLPARIPHPADQPSVAEQV